MNNDQIIAAHREKYPTCSATFGTCPHWRTFHFMVIFEEPDNGFLGKAEAFDKETANQVIRNGLAQTHPTLHVKRLEVDKA